MVNQIRKQLEPSKKHLNDQIAKINEYTVLQSNDRNMEQNEELILEMMTDKNNSTSSNIDNDDSTDNDGQIARTLHESYLLASNNGQKEIIRDIPKQQSASLQKKVNISLNDFRKVLNNIVTSSVERGPLSNELCSEMTVTKMASSEVHVQMNDDAEVALIEQILEIAKWEQMNNGKGVSSDQLLQTAHDKISVALTPETNIL
ncbi:unnamed protein product [Didymodactylos carnosus]|uniref:Uncharacterized protein n=1 Tax=Didymodactylos carnosus TaxID=1234261 RepID=A0A8S2FCD8_9BILA|nr:unnamed protein product [Didymodactylos carnosus]CAF4223446.1 unnamed protein product [Didymodactylos carnosus]